jgi:hypothetical protein
MAELVRAVIDTKGPMPGLTWVTHHRFWALAIGATTLVVVAAAGVWFFILRSPGTQVDLRQAVGFYRAKQKLGQTDPSKYLPSTGVYRYRGSGGEELSFAGISRQFPTATDIIVTQTAGCATMSWEPLEQHVEGWVECPQKNGALSIKSTPSYEQIAGTQNTTVIRCPAGMYFVPPGPFIGQRWHTTCHSPGERIVFSGEVLGLSSVDVGGLKVPALHTHLALSFSGSESGTNPNDFWVSLHNGLILRQRETADLSQQAGPLGSVRYTEQMSISLTSVTPIR